ncbi:cyclopropane-fatty-acyl-phospholipid synthase [Pararhodobacter marinus]|uniref:Cyclopropane-fatty-acyl-phospholipid synthase n=1 Tax=Pararhodobacter marinus TaxID=2184063 RepID=A0A2U2CIM7_9RHOB|nr:FAD-dependent oxidoreductase [Pararhodobacter marinus]PWE31679.1 cyclopropane-fatty-acyl-phospholipid synthase [Pararhodobacter marinus]
MPFESVPVPPKRIAVIGAGISGMAAAWMLAPGHRVTLIEAERRLGGHARTVIAGKWGDQPVDTGFIVFNHANYPNLTAMFEALDVPTAPAKMSFGASFEGGTCEYALANLDTLFATRRNLADPRFLRMVRDILRFNSRAEHAATDQDMSIGNLMDRLGMGRWFRERYIAPFSGAIWSTPTDKIMDFPARAMVEFFRNHALLSNKGQHQWYTVQGGSIQYVTRLERDLRVRGVDIRLNARTEAVRRLPDGVEVRLQGGEWEKFDDVIFATHSDTTLSLLSDASATERAALGAVRYQDNHAVLHCDETLMPKRRKVWSSWSYTEHSPQDRERISLTYWMNSLQPIPQDDPMFVTLNSTRAVREDRIYDEHTFRHPVYDIAAFAAQDVLRVLNGRRNTWFCGAWMKNGFHEDGFASAVDVVTKMGAGAEAEAA